MQYEVWRCTRHSHSLYISPRWVQKRGGTYQIDWLNATTATDDNQRDRSRIWWAHSSMMVTLLLCEWLNSTNGTIGTNLALWCSDEREATAMYELSRPMQLQPLCKHKVQNAMKYRLSQSLYKMQSLTCYLYILHHELWMPSEALFIRHSMWPWWEVMYQSKRINRYYALQSIIYLTNIFSYPKPNSQQR